VEKLRAAGRALATRPWVVMPLVVVIALGGWWGWKTFAGSSSAAAGFGSQIVEVTEGTMDQVVTSEGTVAVADQQDASFTSSGTVTAVNVTAGQTVTAGQVLATIDSAALTSDVASAESALAKAEAQLSDDTSSGASSAQLAADRTSITSAEDQLSAAQEALAGAQLVAELDGTVASVDLTVGEQLGSSGASGTSMTGSESGSGASGSSLGSDSSSSTPGGATGDSGSTDSSTSSAQIVVVSTSSYVVELSLDATEVAEVAEGQPATITLVSSTSSSSSGIQGGPFPGGGFPGAGAQQQSDSSGDTTSRQIAGTSAATGTVTSVSSVADASSGVAEYAVTVSFTDTSGSYNAGASVSVAITYAQTGETLSVPSRAVTTADGVSTVQVSTSGGTTSRTVTTGVTVDGMVQITDGLSAGESVVISGPTGMPGGATGNATDGDQQLEMPTGVVPGGS
jgi:macrolide-specific efflux system membrane fusion protein